MREPRIKRQTVVLVTPAGESQEFEILHAERLLDMGPELNGGWRLAENSKYYYTPEYGLRVKSDKENTAKA